VPDNSSQRDQPPGHPATSGTSEDAVELTFPDLPRLELDQLLGQLVERAQEVMATQGRLRGLLRATQTITSDLSLPVVLRRIAEAARELAGARYAALGVLAAEGGLAEFVHVGLDDEPAARIGHLPEGKGLLGALIEDPQPIRLTRIADDPRSCGFPPDHPAMTSFLGVPIRVRDEVFGNLYLAESVRGEFTTDDEELIKALAATAATVIDNARLYEAARERGEWLQASAAIDRRLLSADLDEIDSLRLIAEQSQEVAHADLVSVVLPDDDGDLRIAVAVGAAAEAIRGLRMPREGSLYGRVFTTGTALRMAGPDERADLHASVPDGLDAGPLLMVPLVGSRTTHGVLSVVRRRGRSAFTAEDLDMATGFANQASVALELARARSDQQRAALLDERERIAADLHDHVIQRLFASGLSLQALAATFGPGRATDRVLTTVADLDATISQIRTAIFALQQTPQAAPRGLRAGVLDVVTEVTPALGFEPAVRFSGLLDTLPTPITDDLLAVLREALTNAARHAHASTVDVELTATRDRVTLDVRDNGTGIDDTTRRSGLANLRHRADHHGGALTVGSGPDGTRLAWSVPLG
jgi:two-component system, NarL family, sensor histidine kinase DevS